MAVLDVVVLMVGFVVTLYVYDRLIGLDQGDHGLDVVLYEMGGFLVLLVVETLSLAMDGSILPDLFDMIWSNLFLTTDRAVTDNLNVCRHGSFGLRMGLPEGISGRFL